MTLEITFETLLADARSERPTAVTWWPAAVLKVVTSSSRILAGPRNDESMRNWEFWMFNPLMPDPMVIDPKFDPMVDPPPESSLEGSKDLFFRPALLRGRRCRWGDLLLALEEQCWKWNIEIRLENHLVPEDDPFYWLLSVIRGCDVQKLDTFSKIIVLNFTCSQLGLEFALDVSFRN